MVKFLYRLVNVLEVVITIFFLSQVFHIYNERAQIKIQLSIYRMGQFVCTNRILLY